MGLIRGLSKNKWPTGQCLNEIKKTTSPVQLLARTEEISRSHATTPYIRLSSQPSPSRGWRFSRKCFFGSHSDIHPTRTLSGLPHPPISTPLLHSVTKYFRSQLLPRWKMRLPHSVDVSGVGSSVPMSVPDRFVPQRQFPGTVLSVLLHRQEK